MFPKLMWPQLKPTVMIKHVKTFHLAIAALGVSGPSLMAQNPAGIQLGSPAGGGTYSVMETWTDAGGSQTATDVGTFSAVGEGFYNAQFGSGGTESWNWNGSSYYRTDPNPSGNEA